MVEHPDDWPSDLPEPDEIESIAKDGPTDTEPLEVATDELERLREADETVDVPPSEQKPDVQT
jgi:hypothetical protein